MSGFGFPLFDPDGARNELSIAGRVGADDSFQNPERFSYRNPIGSVEDALAKYLERHPDARQFSVYDGFRTKLYRVRTQPTFEEI